MKYILSLAAVCAFSGVAPAQQSTAVDPTIVPGLQPLQVVTPIGPRTTTACDDFNRAALGADWVPAGGTPGIYNNRFGSASGSGMAQHTQLNLAPGTAVVSFDIPDAPQVLTFGAAAHGLGGATNTFTKVQSQNVGTYNWIGFYSGLNGPSYGSGFTGITPVVGGVVSVYLTNLDDTMNVEIDENRDGVVDYTYSTSGASAYTAGAGNAIGLSAFGNNQGLGSADDFEVNGGCAPQGPTLNMTGPCPGTKVLSLTGMTAGGIVAITYGPSGSWTNTSPTCNGLTLDLVPIPSFPILTVADGSGNATYTGNAPGGCGNILVQAVDVATCVKTNYEVL